MRARPPGLLLLSAVAALPILTLSACSGPDAHGETDEPSWDYLKIEPVAEIGGAAVVFRSNGHLADGRHDGIALPELVPGLGGDLPMAGEAEN